MVYKYFIFLFFVSIAFKMVNNSSIYKKPFPFKISRIDRETKNISNFYHIGYKKRILHERKLDKRCA